MLHNAVNEQANFFFHYTPPQIYPDIGNRLKLPFIYTMNKFIKLSQSLAMISFEIWNFA